LAATITVATIRNWMWVALAASLGGTLGEITSYYVGYGGQRFVAPQGSQRYRTAERWMNHYGGIAITFFAFVPLFIFDFIGIAAGALRYPVGKFLLFCYAGRLPRAFVEAYFGAEVFKLILSHLPQWVSTPLLG
jgi:membrane protein YqaA with SNARE-associated domain